MDQFLTESFDYVMTVCVHAKESCPISAGIARHRLHLAFEDPADAPGTPDEVMSVFRRVRDEMRREFRAFYNTTLIRELNRRPS